MNGSVLSDYDIKKEPGYSGISGCGITKKVKCKDIETDVRKKDDCPTTDHIVPVERYFTLIYFKTSVLLLKFVLFSFPMFFR